ncbi:MAG: hypothetical protein AAGJ31_15085, partial [Verrucomicrobiota bacterium]
MSEPSAAVLAAWDGGDAGWPFWAQILLWIIFLACLPLVWLTAGWESAFQGLRRHQLKQIARGEPKFSRILRFLFRREEENRIRLSLAASGSFAGVNFLWLSLAFGSRGQPWSGWVWGCGLALLALGLSVLPRTLAQQRPGAFLRTGRRLYLGFLPALRPLAVGLIEARKQIQQNPADDPASTPMTGKEFRALLEMQEERGALHSVESRFIAEVVKLGDKKARDLMTARVEAFMLPQGLSREELFERLEPNDWRKVPLFRQSRDQITAVLDVKSALQHRDQPLSHSLEAPDFVAGITPILTVFRDYLSKPYSLVVVLDEYGSTEGV